jgi:hypothetical protein
MAQIDQNVLTGALAIIKINGQAIGKMRDIRISETFQRVMVPKGLGSIFASEYALTSWSGSISCSFFEISYGKTGLTDALKRQIFGTGNIFSQIAGGNNTLNFEDQSVLDDVGLSLDIYKKIKGTVSNGLITPDAAIYAQISGLFIESDNISITESGISGRDQAFKFLNPVVLL